MPGFQIGSSCEGLNLDSPELDPIYKTCEELGAVLFVHPWDMQMGGRMSKYWLPWLVSEEFGGTSVSWCTLGVHPLVVDHFFGCCLAFFPEPTESNSKFQFLMSLKDIPAASQ